MAGAGAAFAAVADRIRRRGPLHVDEYLELALYDDAVGFYATGGGAGRGRDFLTSPEVGGLFGAVVARAIDAWWRELGEPDPYVVIEAGAGRGTLAASVLDAAPACSPALRYVLVERSAQAREEQARRLALEPPRQALGPATVDDDDTSVAVERTGPVVASLGSLPAAAVDGVVLANELLDNIPFRLLERAVDGWEEVLVALDERGVGLVELRVPAQGADAAVADQHAPDAPVGGRVPVQRGASAWLRDAFRRVRRGRVVVVDYAATTADLARRPQAEWLRTYRGHGRGTHPLDAPGDQDVTADVCVDQLAGARPPAADRSQAEFLRAHGIDDLVADARAAWTARAAIGDLEALRARSRASEGAALVDPAGLGGFRVLEWVVAT